jgi:BolA family transcriptional regulator, general stress-responsive regulator
MSRKDRIEQLLTNEFSPLVLSVEDESNKHHVPEKAQTHFKIIMTSPQFSSITRVQRHRLINTLLKNEFDTGMHALSMLLYSPEEWEVKKAVPQSPNCRDGYKNR